jgi:Ca-activated chloride channel family protein
MGRLADNREELRTKIDGLVPVKGTPLYDVTSNLYRTAVAPGTFDPTRINAIVLLTDGQNDDGSRGDDADQLQGLLTVIRAGNEGQGSTPVRIFPIAYSSDADVTALQAIAEAASSKVYDASDPTTIDQVLTAVVSNF